MKHACHALDCDVSCPPRMLMCPPHWRMVPKHLQRAVYHHYRPGQEIDKNPTDDYLRVAKKAVKAVAKAEGKL